MELGGNFLFIVNMANNLYVINFMAKEGRM